jgi:hypothetical protein
MVNTTTLAPVVWCHELTCWFRRQRNAWLSQMSDIYPFSWANARIIIAHVYILVLHFPPIMTEIYLNRRPIVDMGHIWPDHGLLLVRIAIDRSTRFCAAGGFAWSVEHIHLTCWVAQECSWVACMHVIDGWMDGWILASHLFVIHGVRVVTTTRGA